MADEGFASTNIFRVMVDPRGFMRSVMQGAHQRRWPIIGIVGLLSAWNKGYMLDLGSRYSLGMILLITVILALPIGYITIYASSFVLYWVGKIFRGKASYAAVVSAVIWASVPKIFQCVIWACLILLWGSLIFSPTALSINPIPPLFAILTGVSMIFSIWGFVILLHTLGEVQGLSAWITLWNVVLAAIVFILFYLALQWIFLEATASEATMSIIYEFK